MSPSEPNPVTEPVEVTQLNDVPSTSSGTGRRSLDELRALAERGAAELRSGSADEASPAEVVAWVAANVAPRQAAVACSMADAALPHLVAAAIPGVDVLFLDTGYHFLETTFTRDEVARTLDVRIVDVKPEQTVREQDAEFGKDLFARDPALCCEMRKVAPLHQALGGYEVWFTGVRRDEAPTRANTPLITFDERNGLIKVNPVASLVVRRTDRLRHRARGRGEPTRRQRLPVDRLRSVHQARRRGRRPALRPLGRTLQDRMRTPPMSIIDTLAATRRVSSPAASPSSLNDQGSLTGLDLLEAEAIHIIREVVAEFERPVLLFSGGKDSVLVLHLAARAFAPGRIPFPVLHVDTGHNFDEVIRFRDETVERLGLKLEVARVQDYIDDGRLAERIDGTRNVLQTQPLLDAIAAGKHDAVFGGARRDEDKARAKERIISLRDEFGQWDPRNQRPELWSLYNGRHTAGKHVRAFPISNWTELDVWRYIARERIALPPLYLAHERDVFRRDGMWWAVNEHAQPREGEQIERRVVRYRTVGDASCTGAVTSDAATVDQVVAEVARSTLTERGATRADDRISEAAMEDRKKNGYF